MSFNYYHTNVVVPTLILANSQVFVEKILPDPNNMQIFLEKESFKIAIKSYNEETVKPKVKNITANRIKGSFIVFVEFDDDFVIENGDNKAIAISIGKEGLRFFTYQKDINEENKDDIYIVGELEIKDGNIGNHKKHNVSAEYGINYFAGVIDSIM